MVQHLMVLTWLLHQEKGAVRCMQMAMQGIDHVDYINTHGTSTPVGDLKEA